MEDFIVRGIGRAITRTIGIEYILLIILAISVLYTLSKTYRGYRATKQRALGYTQRKLIKEYAEREARRKNPRAKCEKCGFWVGTNKKECPSCGAELFQRNKMALALLILLGSIFVISTIYIILQLVRHR